MLAEIQIIERTEALSKFESFLRQTTAWVLVITGLDGIGKSQFLKQMIANYSVNNGIALSLTLDFANEMLRQDPLSVLERISNSTAKYCSQDTVEQFNQSLSKMRENILTALNSKEKIEQYITAIGSKVTKNHMIVQQNSKEKVATVKMYAYATACSALCAQLDTFGESTPSHSILRSPSEKQRLLICLDECQQLSQGNLKWVDSLIHTIRTRLSQPKSPVECLVVIASRVKPPLEVIKSYELQHLELTEFTEQTTQNYLELHGITPERLRYIHNLTLGHPLCVSLAAEIYENMRQHYDEAVFTEMFLQSSWTKLIRERVTQSIEPCYAEAIYKCAFAEFFTEDILRQVLRSNNFEYYEFTRLPSVVTYKNNIAYRTIHPLLRLIISEYANKYHPEECKHWKWYRLYFVWLCKQWKWWSPSP